MYLNNINDLGQRIVSDEEEEGGTVLEGEQDFSLNNDEERQIPGNKTASALMNVPGETGKPKVRILTYNFFTRPKFVGCGKEYKNERIGIFLDKFLKDYDIICFQEVFATLTWRRERIILEARKQGFLYYATCDKPNLWQMCLADGGLLIISRYPIVESQFLGFKTPAILSDTLALKGCLYAKIDIGARDGTHLQLFSTHTQASYYRHGVPLFVMTYVSRYQQNLEIREFMDSKIETGSKDIILCVGDMNVNSSKVLHEPEQNLIRQAKAEPEKYSVQLPLMANEYEWLAKALTHADRWRVVDCLKQSKKGGNGNINPVTFGDFKMVDGEMVPVETHLTTEPEDWCSQQCLDYIWEIIPNEREASQVKIQVDETQTQSFAGNYTGYPFNQLSDHYGVSTIIE